MKKILFYTDTPICGGAEKQMLLLAKFLDREKYEVTLCSSAYPHLAKWQKDFRETGFKTIEIKVAHKHDPRHYFAVKKILQSGDFDILHCHIWNPASCRYALQAGIKTKTPIITTEHDPFPLNGFKRAIKKYQLKQIKKIICISQNNLDLLKKLYPANGHKLVLVHNGLDINDFQQQLTAISADQKTTFRQDNCSNYNTDTKFIACIAALHERKGVDLLLQAFAKFQTAQHNYQLLIAGSGPEENNLRQLTAQLGLEKNVLFFGQLQNIPLLLAASDFFVLPSRREAFGLVLLEATCAKLAILATQTGGIMEILSKQEAILVESQNAEALHLGLVELTSKSPTQLQQMCQSAWQRLNQEFSAQKMAEATAQVYENQDTLSM